MWNACEVQTVHLYDHNLVGPYFDNYIGQMTVAAGWRFMRKVWAVGESLANGPQLLGYEFYLRVEIIWLCKRWTIIYSGTHQMNGLVHVCMSFMQRLSAWWGLTHIWVFWYRILSPLIRRDAVFLQLPPNSMPPVIIIIMQKEDKSTEILSNLTYGHFPDAVKWITFSMLPNVQTINAVTYSWFKKKKKKVSYSPVFN